MVTYRMSTDSIPLQVVSVSSCHRKLTPSGSHTRMLELFTLVISFYISILSLNYAPVICNHAPYLRGRGGGDDGRAKVLCNYFLIVPAVLGKCFDSYPEEIFCYAGPDWANSRVVTISPHRARLIPGLYKVIIPANPRRWGEGHGYN